MRGKLVKRNKNRIFIYSQPYCEHRQDICEHLCGKTLRREAVNSSENNRSAAASLWNCAAADRLVMERDAEAEGIVASEVNSFTQNVSSEDNVNVSRFCIELLFSVFVIFQLQLFFHCS